MIRALILAVSAGLALGGASTEQGPRCDTPLTEEALREMIGGGVPAARLRQLIASCGLDLGQADAAATEARLNQIGLAATALTALAPPATAVAGATWVSPLDRRTMVYVAAGKFRMGSDAAERNREADEDAHDVVIADGFWMDVAEVTNEAYRRFVISRPEWQKGNVRPELQHADYLKNWTGTSYPDGRGDHPVAWVGWHAARAYAAWAGKRLPTEAEWEYAARAGSTTRFWWGNNFDAQRVVTDPKTAADGADRRTNPWGLRDTTGSVWEWTASLYRPYPYLAGDGRDDARSAGPRVTRGGSRVNGESFLRSANRSMEDTNAASDLVGFRCAR
jgi:formylglycine-generating enzyme required for sulfatase activity